MMPSMLGKELPLVFMNTVFLKCEARRSMLGKGITNFLLL
jgi:hypothetical protein